MTELGKNKKERKNDISYICASLKIDEKEIKTELKKFGLTLKKHATKIPYRFLYKIKDFIEGEEMRPRTSAKFRLEMKSPAPETSQNKEEILIKSDDLERDSKEERKLKKNLRKSWPTIGPSEDMVYLCFDDVEQIHFILVKDFRNSKDPIDPPGIKSGDLLESALFRPKPALGSVNKYPSVAMAGGALLHAIIHNHPFHNGNKRTALVEA